MSGSTAGARKDYGRMDPLAGIGKRQWKLTLIEPVRQHASDETTSGSTGGGNPPPDKSFFAHIIDMRRSRDRIFGGDLFGEPAWDMLLNLMVARFDEQGMPVHELAAAIGHPESTTIRYIDAMVADDLLERDNQPINPRDGVVRLTNDAAKAMLEFFRKSPAISREPL